ncbi:MAG: periplasmic heavy metal sensor [bacterium]|nr:periplasmic heavy metal sensor [bacterium]
MSKTIVYLLLAASLGLNAGLITTTLIHRPNPAVPGLRHEPDGGRDQEPGPRPGPGQIVDEHVRGMTQHLDLDAQQQQAVRAVLERHAPQLARLQADADDAGRKLSAVYAAAEFDPGRFIQLTAAAGAARARVDSLSAVMLVDEAAVLTTQQRRLFAEVAPTIHSAPQGPPGRNRPPPR